MTDPTHHGIAGGTTDRPGIVVVADSRSRADFVTEAGLDTLRSASEVVLLNLGDVDQSPSLPQVLRTLQAARAVVFAPWGTFGFERLVPECWVSMPDLRVIAGTFDHRMEHRLALEVTAMQRRGVALVDTSRSMTPTVAEFALAMILNGLRDIPDTVALVRSGGWPATWTDVRDFVTGDLRGRHVGLAGYGTITRTLRKLIEPFDCVVGAYDPYVDDRVMADDGVRATASLVELAGTSEILVVGIPPTAQTLDIVDQRVLAALPDGALVVLVSRMRVVHQPALMAEIRSGRLRVAIDVFDPEPPPPDSPLRTHPNVLPTPHIAGNARYCHRRCFETACQDTVEALAGRAPRYAFTLHDATVYGRR